MQAGREQLAKAPKNPAPVEIEPIPAAIVLTPEPEPVAPHPSVAVAEATLRAELGQSEEPKVEVALPKKPKGLPKL
jgi:hypothetical protein